MIATMNATELLSLDIGGTKIHSAQAFVAGGSRPQIRQTARILVRKARSFCDALELLAPNLPVPLERIDVVGIGAKGRIEGESIVHDELPWPIDFGAARRRFGWKKVRPFNDTEAQAFSLADPECLKVAKPIVCVPRERLINDGNLGVVAPGTGLGMAGFSDKSGQVTMLRSEAGHLPFPVVDIEAQLGYMRFLQSKIGPGELRLEAAVCGQALAWNHEFHYGQVVSAMDMPQLLKTHPQSVDTFAWYLGQAIRSAVMAFWAVRGVYIFGGVPERNPEILEIEPGKPRPALIEGMLASATWRDVMERVPVYHLTDPDVAVKGIIIGSALLN